MNYFNRQQIKQLSKLKEHFETVIYAQWKRGTTITENELMADVYERVTGKRLNRNWACGQCVYNAYKEVGELYFKSIMQLETEQAMKTNELGKTVTDKKISKRGRPKKQE